MYKSILKEKNGITLIALVITIIVLLILAGISISMLSGDNSILSKAREASDETRGGTLQEEIRLWKTGKYIDKYGTSETAESQSDLLDRLESQKLLSSDERSKLEAGETIIVGTNEITLGSEDKTAIKLKVTSGENKVVGIPILDTVDCTIDWGDNTNTAKRNTKVASVEEGRYDIATAVPSAYEHTYPDSNKEYIVTISGNIKGIYTDLQNCTPEKILEVVQWGETGLNEIFLGGCVNLVKIAKPSKNSFVNVVSFNESFAECTSLTGIPSGLFDNCPNVGSFGSTFEGCTSLTSIPTGLFDNCPNVESFIETFYECTSLTGNAPELWTRGTNSAENSYRGNPDGEGCFDGCTNLTNFSQIPEYWKRAGK